MNPRNCGGNGRVCISIIGTGNDVTTVHEWVNHTADVKDTAQLIVSGVWKQATATWNGTKEFTWNPACSWPGSRFAPTTVHAEDTRAIGSVSANVFGTNFNRQASLRLMPSRIPAVTAQSFPAWMARDRAARE